MVRLNRIYTRTGDDGSTGLGDGTRVPKFDLRVEALGTVDEVNAAIGMARLHAQGGTPDRRVRGAFVVSPEDPEAVSEYRAGTSARWALPRALRTGR
jgi:hypothetical protein